MTDDRFDRALAARLRAYESRLPDEQVPVPGSGSSQRRRGLPVLLAGGAAAIAAAVLTLIVLQGWERQVGDPDRSPTPAAIATSSASPSSASAPSEEPGETAAATPAASAESSDGPDADAGVAWTRLADLRADGETLSPSGLASRAGLMVLVGTAILSREAQPDLPAPREGRIWLSTDGVSWEAIVDAETFRDAVLEAVLVTADGAFVALGWLDPVGGTITQHVAWQSVDGRRWEQVDLGLPADLTTSARTVAQGPAGFVIGGTRVDGGTGELWHSTDGRNWSLVREFASFENAEGRDIQQVRGGPEGFVATGLRTEGRLHVMASGDGIEWIDAPEQAAVDDMPAVPPLAPLDGDWIASGRGGVDPIEIWHSANGLDWSAMEGVEPVGAGLDVGGDVLGAGSRLFLEASEAFVPGPTWTSADGRRWTLTDLPTELVPVIATALDGGYLLIAIESQDDGDHSISVWSSGR